jgi:aprataxin
MPSRRRKSQGKQPWGLPQKADHRNAQMLVKTLAPTELRKRSLNSPVTELMSSAKKPKPTQKPPPPLQPTMLNQAKKWMGPRDELFMYIEHPEQNPGGAVIEYDDDFVVIQDKYPKATVHMLLMPRSPELYGQHPLKALSRDPEFLAEVKKRVEPLKELVASELRRQHGQSSKQDQPYQTALEDLMSSSDPPPPEQRAALLPPGRDWLREVKVGVHTHPSMTHLHVHILSRDMHSPWMKHKKHYLSFNSSFLVDIEDFPLDEDKDEDRFHPGDWPTWDMVCWRCGKNFKNKFKALKDHLETEFEAWKKE